MAEMQHGHAHADDLGDVFRVHVDVVLGRPSAFAGKRTGEELDRGAPRDYGCWGAESNPLPRGSSFAVERLSHGEQRSSVLNECCSSTTPR